MNSQPTPKERIAARAAREIFPGARVNLGIGLPTLIPRYLPAGVAASLHSENGFLGMGPATGPGLEDEELIDAGGRYVNLEPGGAFFDSSLSFTIIRGGRLDLSFLGAFEVDMQGNLANWRIPGKRTPGIGGAMELAQKAARVVVTTLHCSSQGSSKLVGACKLPLTASGVIGLIITELAVLEPNHDNFRVLELAPGVSLDELRSRTNAPLDASHLRPWEQASNNKQLKQGGA